MDWGGVLTAPLGEAMARWLTLDDVSPDHFGDVLRAWFALGEDTAPTAGAATPGGSSSSPVHALERGELPEAEFERLLAAALGERGSPVVAEGLLDRVLAGLAELDEDMVALVQRVRGAGVPVALVSNSWGERYPERLFDGLFDAIVISGRLGIRKPEAGIFQHAAHALGVPLDRCVLVDDIDANLAGAQLVGAGAIRHTDPVSTLAALDALLGQRSEAKGGLG